MAAGVTIFTSRHSIQHSILFINPASIYIVFFSS